LSGDTFVIARNSLSRQDARADLISPRHRCATFASRVVDFQARWRAESLYFLSSDRSHVSRESGFVARDGVHERRVEIRVARVELRVARALPTSRRLTRRCLPVHEQHCNSKWSARRSEKKNTVGREEPRVHCTVYVSECNTCKRETPRRCRSLKPILDARKLQFETRMRKIPRYKGYLDVKTNDNDRMIICSFSSCDFAALNTYFCIHQN